MSTLSSSADDAVIRREHGLEAQAVSARFGIATLLVVIAVLWVMTRPYLGVFQDGRFYAVEALHVLMPQRFATDLYFRFGSQDNFTIYSRLYAPLISLLGLGTAALVATIAGQLLWLGALLRLASALMRDRTAALLAVIAAVALPSGYGMYLGYAEPFASPRLFAEAFDLLALGFLFSGRRIWALLLLALAVPLHPLMALTGFGFVLIYLAFERPIWWLVAVGGAALAIALSFAGVQPFANLRVTYDPEWFRIVKLREPLCLISEWGPVAYFRALDTVAFSLTALALARPSERRVLGVALAIGLGGLLCSLVGGDVLHDVFILEIQPWRTLWLPTLFANLYAVSTVMTLLRAGDRLDLTRLGFVTAVFSLLMCQFMSNFSEMFIFPAASMMAVTAGLAIWQAVTGRPLTGGLRGLVWALIGCGWLAIIACVFGMGVLSYLTPRSANFYRYLAVAVVPAALVLTVVVTRSQQTGRRRQRRTARWTLPLALALLPAALYGWDARSAWNKFIEAPGPAPASLAEVLPADASVYWEGGLEMLWLRLRRPSYFSCDQGTGALFYRATAIEYWRQAQNFWPLHPLDFGSAVCPTLDDSDNAQRSRADLASVCRREPALDYMVLARPAAAAAADIPAKTWIAPAKFHYDLVRNGQLKRMKTNRFYVYSCADLR
jgi:hypothetical protein